jgi:hypothetical protein
VSREDKTRTVEAKTFEAKTFEANAFEAETFEAKTIVELIRAQNWKDGGVLLVDEADAIRLVVTALRIAEHRGVIDGMERIGAIVDKALPAAGAPGPGALLARE